MFKNLLLWNRLANRDQSLMEWSSGGPLSELYPRTPPGNQNWGKNHVFEADDVTNKYGGWLRIKFPCNGVKTKSFNTLYAKSSAMLICDVICLEHVIFTSSSNDKTTSRYDKNTSRNVVTSPSTVETATCHIGTMEIKGWSPITKFASWPALTLITTAVIIQTKHEI